MFRRSDSKSVLISHVWMVQKHLGELGGVPAFQDDVIQIQYLPAWHPPPRQGQQILNNRCRPVSAPF